MGNQTEASVREKLDLLAPLFDEQTRRLWAVAEAQVLGRSKISLVARATGLSRTKIHQGIKDLAELHETKVLEKKKLVSEFKNGGQAWQPKGKLEQVQGHDFPDPNWVKRIPMGCTIKTPASAG